MSDTTWITSSIDGLRDDLHALYRDFGADIPADALTLMGEMALLAG